MRKIMAVSVMIMMLLCGCASSSAEQKPTMSAPPLESEMPDNEHLSSSKSEKESSSDPVNTPTPIIEQKSVFEIADIASRNVETAETRSVKVQAPKATAAPTPSQTPTPTPTPISTPSPTPAPQVNIAYWVSYAKSCASSLGLTLNSSAADCWDNPITATSKSTCLKRDISSRLSRYAADEDITDVWIWSESIGNGSYNIYIGYA